MDTLKHIGVQRWRLKPGFAATPNKAEPASASAAVESADSSILNKAQPVGDLTPSTAVPAVLEDAGTNAVEAVSDSVRSLANHSVSGAHDDSGEGIDGGIGSQIASQAIIAPAPVLEAIEQEAGSVAPQMNDESTTLQNLDWAGLQQLVVDWKHCPSCSQGNSLLGFGDTQASWLFVIDAPSRAELEAGQIFAGRAGKLFDAMLNALQLKREMIYCTSVFKCAATENLGESPQCDDLLQHQINLIKPDVVVTFGEFAAQKVIKANGSLATLRESTQQCYISNVMIVPTYSPAEMLDEPSLKALVWQDLKRAQAMTNTAAKTD